MITNNQNDLVKLNTKFDPKILIYNKTISSNFSNNLEGCEKLLKCLLQNYFLFQIHNYKYTLTDVILN